MSLKTLFLLHLGIGLPIVGIILLPTWAGLKEPPSSFGTVPAFELTDQTGSPFRASDLEGKVTVIDFVFTQCRGICPVLHQQMQLVRRQFGDRVDLQLVSISIDPENDTPERLAAFATSQGLVDPRWHFLTGKREAVRALLEQGLKVGMTDQPEVHSDRFVLVDPERKIRGFYSLSDPKRLRQLRPEIAKLFKQADLRTREPAGTAGATPPKDTSHDL